MGYTHAKLKRKFKKKNQAGARPMHLVYLFNKYNNNRNITKKLFCLMVKGSLQVLRGSGFDFLLLHFVQNLIKRLMMSNKNINKSSINVNYNIKIFFIFLKISFLL